jgi:hypothetical protein
VRSSYCRVAADGRGQQYGPGFVEALGFDNWTPRLAGRGVIPAGEGQSVRCVHAAILRSCSTDLLSSIRVLARGVRFFLSVCMRADTTLIFPEKIEVMSARESRSQAK